MFRSYETGKDDKIVLIMNVFPGGEPSSGPNYYNFDPNVRYAFHLDNNLDGKAEDIEFEFQFRTEVAAVDQLGFSFPSGLAPPPPCATPLPAITALDGAGSEGLGLRQRYSVTMVRDGKRQKLADGLIAVPSNVGPSTMPNYAALAAQGVQRCRMASACSPASAEIRSTSISAQVSIRSTSAGIPPLLTAAEDANDDVNPFGIDMIGSLNVQTIALEVPAALLTRDRAGPGKTKSRNSAPTRAPAAPRSPCCARDARMMTTTSMTCASAGDAPFRCSDWRIR